MIREHDILEALDHSKDGTYCTFISLGDVYSYLIDSRLNLFRNESDQWAIVAERLGYNPRAGRIEIEISYYGNCLINLEEYNNQNSNYYIVYPIDHDSFDEASNSSENINKEAATILVRGKEIKLSHQKSDYLNAEINLREYEPDEITWEEAVRLLIMQHKDLFRAKDEELYKSIPKDLKKILVIDEWYRRDFQFENQLILSDEQLRHSFEFNKNITGLQGIDFESFSASVRNQEESTKILNNEQWNENRPSAYETWQQIAKVIATGDISFYKPTFKPNSHWINWSESGTY